MGSAATGTFVAVTGQLNDAIVTLAKMKTEIANANKSFIWDSSGVPTAQAAGMQLITEENASNAANVTWSSLTGKRYLILLAGTFSAAPYIGLQINGVTTAGHYTGTGLKITGSTVSALNPADGSTYARVGYTAANSFCTIAIEVACSGDVVGFVAHGSPNVNSYMCLTNGQLTDTGQTAVTTLRVLFDGGNFTGRAACYALG